MGLKTLAIDPGNIESAFVVLDGEQPRAFDKAVNDQVLEFVGGGDHNCKDCVIEMVACYGMAVGKEVFETVYWIGRFAQVAMDAGMTVHRRVRQEVKLHLCKSPKAKDGNIRQAIIDRFGGQDLGVGGVKCPKCKGKGWVGRDHAPCPEWLHPPGPLHGISADVWQALALGLLFVDKQEATTS